MKPVPEPRVYAIKSHVSRQVWAMVELQLLTGMRNGEVTAMRPVDLNTTGTLWVYTPPRHKTTICVGSGSVCFPHRLRFLHQIQHIRCRELHAVSRLVGRNGVTWPL